MGTASEGLKELLGKATPGPWVHDPGGHDHPGEHACILAGDMGQRSLNRKHVAAVGNAEEWIDAMEEWQANAALIVAAVNNLPALIECVEAGEQITDALDAMVDEIPPNVRLAAAWVKCRAALSKLSTQPAA